MVTPERRACSRAAASDFSDGSMPVTVAPSAASVSARMPPPQPTSRTRFPPNPPNTPRKYSTRNVFSSCSPAKGPALLHQTPGTRSTRRSYFSGSERPPRRGRCSDMGTNLRRGGGWGRLGRLGEVVPTQGLVELPCEKAGAALEVAQARPVLLAQYAGFLGESERVTDLAQRGKGDVEESTEFFSAAACRPFDDVHGGGERSAARLRGEPVALVIWEFFCHPVDRQGELVAFAPSEKPFVPRHALQNTGRGQEAGTILARGESLHRDQPPPA